MDSGSGPIKRIQAAALLTRIPGESERAALLGDLIDPALPPETTDRVLIPSGRRLCSPPLLLEAVNTLSPGQESSDPAAFPRRLIELLAAFDEESFHRMPCAPTKPASQSY